MKELKKLARLFAGTDKKIWMYLEDNVDFVDGEYRVLISLDEIKKHRYLNNLKTRTGEYMTQRMTIELDDNSFITLTPFLAINYDNTEGLKIVLNESIGEMAMKRK